MNSSVFINQSNAANQNQEKFHKKFDSVTCQKTTNSYVNFRDFSITNGGVVILNESVCIKILNCIFGPGNWLLAFKCLLQIYKCLVLRKYSLICDNNLVSRCFGVGKFYFEEAIFSTIIHCEASALSRCCKHLGIAVNKWDEFKLKYCSNYSPNYNPSY
ncbi:uncharacterized protein ASCRUDRAFT_117255 [Ascoidea rubescens DSM 1968]|uniref:Mitochondrial genome maintenance protein MGM101 n=1 Tax=Ascoidea rubescens DSM 1968 TaxID=1344418 RepID=A0A1D2VBN2_9ASCO|nr:hypothetical protein ASCRUDRAFT_117255 [Ascoidea rubescens DSM 1968]ODV58867.1 hypothetical protein ASCRUDRAFT_117255 [Ascoidea rubescens DSM 1968]